jgi:ATP-dependent Clp protease protease subunit
MEQSEQVGIESPKYRNLFFNKDIDEESIGEIVKQIVEINEHDEKLKIVYKGMYELDYSPKPIKIFIDSSGGSIYSCFGLLSLMKCSKTPIHTYVTGSAMSAGFLILICGHKRFGYELSTLLYHQVTLLSEGKSKELEDDCMEMKRLQSKMESIILERTNITRKKLKEIYSQKKEWYMDAEEAKRMGVIDDVIYESDIK